MASAADRSARPPTAPAHDRSIPTALAMTSTCHPTSRMPRPRRHRATWLLALVLSACGGGGSQSTPSGGVQVQAVVPASGGFAGGTAVTIHGARFALSTENIVLFGGRPATDVVVVDAQTLQCRTPSGTPGASVEVVVQNAQGIGRKPGGFAYTLPAEPRSDLNGDGIADLVVAAVGDSTAGAGAGAVFVFFGRSQSFQLDGLSAAQADVKLVGQKAGDAFGSCICTGDVDGDGMDDLIVGAPKADVLTAEDAGAVYVFRGPLAAGSVILAQAADVRLTGSIAAPGDEFGSFAALGDVTGDGQLDLLVGAPRHDNQTLLDAGCAYVFHGGASFASRSADSADRAFDGMATGDRLGTLVTCGDLDSDGIDDLVLCAPAAEAYEATVLYDAGAVYVLRGGAQLATASVGSTPFTFRGEGAWDRFGDAVALADLDGDGAKDLIVGAPYNDAGDPDTGRAYVFPGGLTFAGGAASLAPIRFTGVPTQGSVGRTLRTGDVDGDGLADLVVGAPQADAGTAGNGRLFLFLGSSALASRNVLEADASFSGEIAAGNALGSALSLLDIDGDGFADVAASSPLHAGLGRVYLWRGGQGALVGSKFASQCDVEITGSSAASRFGEALAQGQ